jgi:hypothetical protein
VYVRVHTGKDDTIYRGIDRVIGSGSNWSPSEQAFLAPRKELSILTNTKDLSDGNG